MKGQNGICYTDWIIATANWQQLFLETSLLKLSFNYFDQDKDGFISSIDLYRSINGNFEINQAIQLLSEINIDKDGMTFE